jgi:hypothetical protein
MVVTAAVLGVAPAVPAARARSSPATRNASPAVVLKAVKGGTGGASGNAGAGGQIALADA